MSLPDGIYSVPAADPATAHYLVWVRDGKWALHLDAPSGRLGHSNGLGVESLPADTSTWTRVADLPDLRMAEPNQIGYPVMASCNDEPRPHLHIRAVDKVWPWACSSNAHEWWGITGPRDLTADEIAAHNLWQGGAS